MPPAQAPPIPEWIPIDPPARDPVDAIARWPLEVPLAALCSGQSEAPDSRWSLLAPCTQVSVSYSDTEVALRSLLPSATSTSGTEVQAPRDGRSPPFGPGWIVAIGYEAGFEVEPSVRGRVRGHADPLARSVVARVDRAIAHDRLSGQWWSLGGWTPKLASEVGSGGLGIGPVRSRVGEAAFVRMVERGRELIRAGDVYQVNLAHALEAAFMGSARALCAALLETARPWHGAYLEFAAADGSPVAIASASPELFLRYDPRTRIATTRPMKGTRDLSGSGARADLDASPKDRAELAMIIDLMRNDLGRSCVLGSVRVEEARRIERHASAEGRGLLQATGVVRGTLRADRTPIDLFWSAFPPGSVTGAPKVRAMQIIDELEPEPRGFYCGSIGHVGDDGSLHLNVAIRTATVRDGVLTYPVGAGIVADSDPASEWRETLAKAWPLMRLAGR